MAGLEIPSNTVTLDLNQNVSYSGVKTITGNFTIVIPSGSKGEGKGNTFKIETPGGYEIIINDVAGEGWSASNFSEEENILNPGVYMFICVYTGDEVFIRVIDNIFVPS